MNFLIVILFNSLAVSSILNDANKVDEISQSNYKLADFVQSKETLCQFKIEDQLVSETEFHQFCDSLSLVEIEGTYVCKKMVDGGHFWYDALANDGNVYVVGAETAQKLCLDYIHLKR